MQADLFRRLRCLRTAHCTELSRLLRHRPMTTGLLRPVHVDLSPPSTTRDAATARRFAITQAWRPRAHSFASPSPPLTWHERIHAPGPLQQNPHSLTQQLSFHSPGSPPLALRAQRSWVSGLLDLEDSGESARGKGGRKGEWRRRNAAPPSELDLERELESTKRPARGRNQQKRASKAARDYGLELIDLSPKEASKVVRWANLPEETMEAVSLAKALTRRGKNGWRRQVLYVGGLLRGVSAEILGESIRAAKDGSPPSFLGIEAETREVEEDEANEEVEVERT